MHTLPLRGILLVLCSASLWGTTGTAQALSGATLPAAWFGALRLLVAALFFATLWVARSGRGRPPAASIGWPGVVLAGLCMAIYNLAFFAGIRATGIALGTALALGSGPLWTGALQAITLRRWPAPGWWLGTALAVLGGALMSGLGRVSAIEVDAPGIVLCLAAGLSYAVYTLVTQRLGRDAPALDVTLHAFGVAALIAVPWAWIDTGLPAWRVADIVAVVYVGVFTAGVAYWVFGVALRHVSAATGVTLALFEPVVACVLAAVVLGEAVPALSWLGLLMVLGGVGVVVRSELRSRPTLSPINGLHAPGPRRDATGAAADSPRRPRAMPAHLDGHGPRHAGGTRDDR